MLYGRRCQTPLFWNETGERKVFRPDILQEAEKRGEVAYQLELPPQLSDVHDVFHVSQLKKCLLVPEEQIPMEDLDAKEDLSYQEYLVKILETPEGVTRNKKIKICKV
jgi:hypothetical protein